ncbi:MAG: 23S rRNA (pseudouridine(1915)-N(3))-methyltransferase RlmH [Candidatus Protistobacter heckmanni]|nr:23S rRNA (pseudouridine(1915)-N(3))-methyltransferase RlmH [Candidatus Protistobacter heckmanni]
MQLLITAVGNKMPAWVEEAFADYAKRMPPELRVELREIRPEPRTTGKTPAAMMQAEAERIQAVLPKPCHLVALDERGKDWTSQELSRQLARWQEESLPVAFVIGGPDGLAPEIKSQAQTLLRFSSLTLPHGMARVLLAEQLYRAWSMLANHPYHRA